MKLNKLPENHQLYSERAAARYLGINPRTLRELPIPRVELLRDDKPNAQGHIRKRRFIRYEQLHLDAFRREHITTPEGWNVNAPAMAA